MQNTNTKALVSGPVNSGRSLVVPVLPDSKASFIGGVEL